MMKKLFVWAMILSVGVFFLLACSSGKGPAEVAVQAAEEAVNAAKAEAVKLLPDDVKSLEDSLAAAKEKLIKKEYKDVLEEATALAGKAKEVMDAAKAKKDELTGVWTEMSGELPNMVEGIQGKVDELAKLKKLPAGMTKDALEEAKAELASIKEEWAKAQESFAGGNFIEAVNIGTALKEKGIKIMESLGMRTPMTLS